MSKIFRLASSGIRAVFSCPAQAELDGILSAFQSRERRPQKLAVKIIFQKRNKRKILLNSFSMAEDLGLLCVDAIGAACLQEIEPNHVLHELTGLDRPYYVFESKTIHDPFSGGAGVEELIDGQRRLRSPIIEKSDSCPSIFRLPPVYESSEDTYCTEEAAEKIRKSGATGFVCWDYESKAETRLWS